mmetsp:Transcript_10471/g.22138  ORF Transcript_10471/g.22138 Transcript_10471/m.22138 type:complete len:259 (+) Transcript_10471:2023-2799(+)
MKAHAAHKVWMRELEQARRLARVPKTHCAVHACSQHKVVLAPRDLQHVCAVPAHDAVRLLQQKLTRRRVVVPKRPSTERRGAFRLQIHRHTSSAWLVLKARVPAWMQCVNAASSVVRPRIAHLKLRKSNIRSNLALRHRLIDFQHGVLAKTARHPSSCGRITPKCSHFRSRCFIGNHGVHANQPDNHTAVLSTSCEQRPVRAEFHAPDRARVCAEQLQSIQRVEVRWRFRASSSRENLHFFQRRMRTMMPAASGRACE